MATIRDHALPTFSQSRNPSTGRQGEEVFSSLLEPGAVAAVPGRSMGLLAGLHEALVFNRRAQVLSERLAALLPKNARVLDVGRADLAQHSDGTSRIAAQQVAVREARAHAQLARASPGEPRFQLPQHDGLVLGAGDRCETEHLVEVRRLDRARQSIAGFRRIGAWRYDSRGGCGRRQGRTRNGRWRRRGFRS